MSKSEDNGMLSDHKKEQDGTCPHMEESPGHRAPEPGSQMDGQDSPVQGTESSHIQR